MRRPFLLSVEDAFSLRSSFLRERDLSRSRLPASLVTKRIIAVAEVLCLFPSAFFNESFALRDVCNSENAVRHPNTCVQRLLISK